MSAYISILLIVIVVFLLGYTTWKEIRKNHRTVIPFKEAVDLIGLPVVTFMNDNKKLHFLLDTGSDDSFMDIESIEGLSVVSKAKGKGAIITGNGEINSLGSITCFITYKGISFLNTFMIGHFKETFEAAARDKGVTIHGILGSRFFKKYKYKLDFESMEAQSNKGCVIK